MKRMADPIISRARRANSAEATEVTKPENTVGGGLSKVGEGFKEAGSAVGEGIAEKAEAAKEGVKGI